jgi:hypothetical protein
VKNPSYEMSPVMLESAGKASIQLLVKQGPERSGQFEGSTAYGARGGEIIGILMPCLIHRPITLEVKLFIPSCRKSVLLNHGTARE